MSDCVFLIDQRRERESERVRERERERARMGEKGTGYREGFKDEGREFKNVGAIGSAQCDTLLTRGKVDVK
jgi:hypothetical protein